VTTIEREYFLSGYTVSWKVLSKTTKNLFTVNWMLELIRNVSSLHRIWYSFEVHINLLHSSLLLPVMPIGQQLELTTIEIDTFHRGRVILVFITPGNGMIHLQCQPLRGCAFACHCNL